MGQALGKWKSGFFFGGGPAGQEGELQAQRGAGVRKGPYGDLDCEIVL